MTRSETTSLEERLRFALQTERTAAESVEMSAAVITGRLRDACEMSSLCLVLVDTARMVRR